MATILASKSGNWSDPTVWVGGVVPGDGDTADLATYAVTMDVPTLPASGSLLALQSNVTGYLLVPLSSFVGVPLTLNILDVYPGGVFMGIIRGTSVVNAPNLTLNGQINPSSGGRGIYFSDVYSSALLTINGDVYGGTGSNTYGAIAAWNTVINGDVYGGSGSNSFGYLATNGTVTVNGDVVAGSYGSSSGSSQAVACNLASIVITINGGNIIDSLQSSALYSRQSVAWVPGSTNYYQLSSGAKLAPLLLAEEIKAGVVCGGVVGTFEGGTIIEAPIDITLSADFLLEVSMESSEITVELDDE